MYQKIKNQLPGSEITFAGKQWLLINPENGLVFMQSSLKSGPFSGMKNNNTFDINDPSNVGYYLNTTYYNSLSKDERVLITDWSWGVGSFQTKYSYDDVYLDYIRGEEEKNSVQARICLLSYSELRDLQRQGKLPLDNRYRWSRTPHFMPTYLTWASYNNNMINQEATNHAEIQPALHLNPETFVRDGVVAINEEPTIELNTSNNQTLHENGLLRLDGSSKDVDIGDVVTVKYQINSGTVRNLHSAISDGNTPILFSKELTYSEGILKDGNTALTSVLSKDQPHTVSVWAEDGNGGKSEVITRTFYVVPNRPPTLKVDPIAAKSNLINSDVINVNGSVEDLDNNDVVVTMQINDQEPVEVYTGKSGAWAFNIALKDLRVGANTITIKAADIYDAFTSKVLTIRKTHDATPVNEAIALYKINPPTGSAQKILLWIERQLGDLAVTAETSMTNDGEPENFVSLPRTNTAPKEGLQEDEFAYQDVAQKTNIMLKIIYNRTDSAAVAANKKVSGVLS